MIFKNKWFQFVIAIGLGIVILALPRPEGTIFSVSGDSQKVLYNSVKMYFTLKSHDNHDEYQINIKEADSLHCTVDYLKKQCDQLGLNTVHIDYVDGLSPKGKRFLAILFVLIFLFVFEPIPLEITAICIGVSLVVMGITDVKNAWAPYMHPVVVFIMCCLIFACALEKVGLTKRLGQYIVRKAGSSVVRFTFILSIGLGLSSSFMHDAAACAIGIVTMLPLMRAVGIKPYSRTGKFMMLSLPFACSCGGMGSLIGGGRCMVSAAFLKEFTGIEISFMDWIIYCMPLAIITVPIAVLMVYLVYRPDPSFVLPKFEKEADDWSTHEKLTLIIIVFAFGLWLTKSFHGIHYSVTGMMAVTALVLVGILKWEDIHSNLEWGTALFIFGGGISLGLAMGYSGAATYFANLFFPLVKGGGWLLLFAGVAVFGALITNAMANVAAAALILPIVLPMAQLEGVNPTVIALCLGTATSFAMLLVIGCPPNAIAYSFRYFKALDLTRAGIIVMPVLLAVLILSVSIWWKILGLI
jgi:sodium-dependent dicarboxylate transporter 2/3/5